MSARALDRLVTAGVFLLALVVYLTTVAPTLSFWDPGERIAAAHGLQIPHPPGAPFYMLLGRLFSMFVPTAYVALSINLMSVLASAGTVALVHRIILRLVQEWKGPRASWDAADRLAAHAGGVVGALALAFSDAFWFNALEAETYATSTFFTALCVWLALKWLEQARRQDALLAANRHHTFGTGAERWLIAIAYVYGLAIGVHLLSLLSLFFAALIVFFQHVERPEWTRFQLAMRIVLAGAVSSAVFLLIYPGIIQFLPELARQSGAPVAFLVGLVLVLALGIWYTHRQRWAAANLLLLCVAVVLVGYSTYGVILIRSAANPPIDQNDPETVDAFISYMKREQYGATPLFRGPAFDDRTGRVSSFRERWFPRRWSAVPEHEAVYAQYRSDGHFFWSYQIGHMYVRYFLWQWVGRESDRQGAPATTGLFRTASAEARADLSPSERASRNVYFGLPLLLGLFGMAFHVARDWRRALAVGVLFFITGIGIVLYLNQTPLQPRERDYSYTGSFFAFSLWIGIGATGLVELTSRWLREQGRTLRTSLLAGGALTAVLLAAVPGLLFAQNRASNDRTGQYLPWDFAHNMLMSVGPNAILFTNGDNDTFPLWYLQEVEGIRRDVRVVNLSLLQTEWYIRQLRNQWSRESAPLPMTLSEDAIARLRPVQWDPVEVSFPIGPLSPERLASWGDPEVVPEVMRWRVEGRDFGGFRVLLINDLVILSILEANAAAGWPRPIYFATTTALDGQVGLQRHLQHEGLALQVTPLRSATPGERVVPEIALERLDAFRFRNLDNPRVYYDENSRNMIDNYRSAVFAPIARQLAEQGRVAEAQQLLDRARTAIPFEVVRPSFVALYLLAEAYQAVGDDAEVVALMRRAEPIALRMLEDARTERELSVAAQYVQAVQAFYVESRAFDEAAAFSDRIAVALGDDRFRQTPDDFRRLAEEPPERPAPEAAEPAPADQTIPLESPDPTG